MRTLRPSLLLLLAVAAAGACTTRNPAPAPVRDVRPTTLEIGEKLTVETSVPLVAGADTTVILKGVFEVPGEEPRPERSVTLPARATAPEGHRLSTRVLADADQALQQEIGGHAYFRGTVTVQQKGRPSITSNPVELDLFPRTLRALAVGAARDVSSVPAGLVLILVLLIPGLVLFLLAPVSGGIVVVWERKISGLMQSRFGPNRVGPNGWLQWLADAIKLITKEDLVPAEGDNKLFRLAPYLVFAGVFGVFMVLPMSQLLVVSDLNIGVLYLLSVTALVVVGIIMGGWSSNSKWSLLGGMRSAAQIISYELPASLSVLMVIVMAGTLSTQGLVHNQGGSPWNWHLFDNPLVFAGFFIYFMSALAEGNRTPFDLPEAESELVSGYNTEYSGFRFGAFAMSEWVNLVVIGGVATTIFLGGWRIPGVSPADTEASILWQIVSALVFTVKTVFMIFAIIWVRWTFPRFRVDHMMDLCWKWFLPITLVSLVLVAAWVWVAPPLARQVMRYATFALFGVGGLAYFFRRVRANRKTIVPSLRGAA